jgi:hypothetical protein
MYIIVEEGVRRTDDDAGILPTHVFVSGQVVMPLLGLETFLSPTSHSQVRILRHSFETVCVCRLPYRDRPVMFHAYAHFVQMVIAFCDPTPSRARP